METNFTPKIEDISPKFKDTIYIAEKESEDNSSRKFLRPQKNAQESN